MSQRQALMHALTNGIREHKDTDGVILMSTQIAELILDLLKEPEPHVMTLEEIRQAPDFSLLWEESLIKWEDHQAIDIAPMEKRGGRLYGIGMITPIGEDMFGSPAMDSLPEDLIRYWNARPTEEQSKAVAWE